MDKIINVLVVGIGGQGVMTASEVIALCALEAGYDVKKTEVAGMAQRGGVVSSHVRFGQRVLSPVIVQGDADLMLAFEAAEAMRWANHLKPGGSALVNSLISPPPVVTLGLFDYPEDPIATMRARPIDVVAFDAGAIARDLGNIKLVNTVMLGAISEHLPFPAEQLKQQVVERFRARKPHLADLNEQAFDAGHAAQEQASNQHLAAASE
jgi:indolepyruvate ferredoxin oxidoreductase beta subunit